ncbi:MULTISPECIES: phage tail tape measure protein [Paenibacillus]|uniref:TP901 family phage tail tape measure protein n=1 Tax=Paenibacillus pabuli TaxID=1472 RepID=A0A855XWD1_9BACL|nr:MULTISPECIES: phage tail tape measure protein [Paenibacillus]PWW37402.1 TP901 family phage tail tape measure protein [Paenibacillus pabuli]PXW05544.1 TP901 family phage tail tape measure protein [Paenibacillus taichungensis]
MADEIEVANLVTKLTLSDSGVEQSMAQLSRQMRVVQSEFEAASSKLGTFGSAEEQLRVKADSLNKQMDIQGQRIVQLKKRFDETAQSKGADAKETQNLENKLNRAVAEYNKMDAALKSTESEIQKQTSAWNKMSGALDAAAKKMESAGRAMSNAGMSLTAMFTAPLAAVAGLAGKASIEYETAFAGVRKTVDATEEELQKFSDGIRDMSKEIPASAAAIAEVAEAAGQLGIKNESLLAFTRTMSDLGVATNMTSTQAATDLSRLANITKMPQENFDRLGASIVGLGNNLATTESEIVAMSLRLAAAGSQVGLSEAQILGLGGALSSLGLEAEGGGSAFSRVMISMANAAATGGKQLNNFALVAGTSAKEFQQRFKTDAAGALSDFTEGLGRMSAAGENTFAVLDALGLSEIVVRDALLRASGAGDLLRESIDLGTQSWEENTALVNEASTRYQTTASQIEIMKNRVMDAAITLGDALKPALLAVMTALEPIILKMTEFANMFAQLDQSTQTTIITIAAVVAALGPVLLIVGQLSMSIAALIPVVQALGTALTFLATNPWGLAITAVVSTLAIMTTGILSAKAATEELTAAQVALQEVQQNGIDRAEIASTEEKIAKINELTESYKKLVETAQDSNAAALGNNMKALVFAADELGISMDDLRKKAREFGVDLQYVDDKGNLSTKSLKDLKAATDTYSTAVKNAQKATASEINEMARAVAVRQQQINSTLNMVRTYNTAKQGTQEWAAAQKGLIDQFPQFANATGVNTEAIKGLILVKQREVELEWQSIQVKAAEARQEKITAIAKQEAAITIVNGINKIAGASGIAEGALNKMNAELTRLRGEAASLQALLDMKPGDFKLPTITAAPIPTTGSVAGLDLPDSKKKSGSKGKKEKTPKEKAYENAALDAAYKQMEHKKKMDQLTLESELKTLETIKAKYVKTADERMEIEERIYAVKKELGDKSLDKALKDYDRSKDLGKLTEAQEIDRLKRIKKLYADSAEERERIDDMIFEATQRKIEKEKEVRKEATEYASKMLQAAYEDKLAREELTAEQQYKLQDKLLNDQIYLNQNYLDKVMKDSRYSAQEKKDIEREYTEAIRVQTNERLNLARKYAEEEKKILEQNKKEQIDSINNLSKGIQDALKAKYQEEKKLAEDAIKDQISANEEWKKSQLDSIKSVYDARVAAAQKAADDEIAAITSVTNAQVEAIQAQLDALNQAEKQRSRAELDADDQKKIDRLTGMIDYEHDAFNREQLQKELNKVIADQNERHRQEQLADTKEALTKEQQELKTKLAADTQIIKDNLATKKEIMQADYEADVTRINALYETQKASLNAQLAETQATYDKMLDAKKIQAEAEKMIVQNQQKEIVELLKGFGDAYNLTGQTLGEKMYQGFAEKVNQIQGLISSINSQIDAARSSAVAALNTISAAGAASSGSSGGKSSTSGSTDTRQAVKVEVVNNFNSKVTSPSDVSRSTQQSAQRLAGYF